MPSPSPPPLEQAVDEGSTVPTLLHPSPIEQVELEIRWKSWPLVDRLPHSISAILLLVAVSCGMWWTKDSLVIGLLAGGLVAMTMLGYLLPTHYSVGLLGITATRGRWSRLHRWDDIGCVQFADDTMLLFPLPDPRPVDLLFATTVHCDEQYAMVAAYVRGLGTWDGSPGRLAAGIPYDDRSRAGDHTHHRPGGRSQPVMYRNLYIIIAACGICLAIFAVSFSGRATFSTGGGDLVDFIFNNATEPQTLDPGIMSGQPEGALAIGLFEGLTCYHPQTLQPMPGVAKSWEIEGLTYSFELRRDHWWVKQGAIYEVDGQPRNVVAGDFIYAWRRHLHPETGSEYSYLLYLIEGTEEYERAVTEHWTELINRYKQKYPDVVLVKPSSLIDPVAAGASNPQVLRADYEALEKFRNEAWDRLVKVRAVGDYQLNVTLRSPAPYFLDLTSFYTLAPAPREAIEAYDRQWILPENIVTNGPYSLHDWRFNSFIRLKKNIHYWENAAYAAQRIASLEARAADELRSPERAELEFLKQYGSFVEKGFDTLDALAVEEQTTSLNLYINGDVDRIREVPTAVVGDLIALSETPGKQLGDVHHGVYNAAYFYNLNVELPIFKAGPEGELGRKVRQALALAVDRRTLIDVVTRAHQEPAYRLVPDGVIGYSDLPLFGSGDYAKDLVEAKRLIDEVRAAGVEIPKLKILYNSHEAHAKVAVFIQGLWKEHLGIDVETSNQEWGVFLDSRRTGNYEIARSGWIGDYTDPNTFLDMFTSNNQNNDPNYNNPLYDRIILKYAAYILDYLETAEQRQAMLADLQSWPHYEAVVADQRRPDGTKLGEALVAALTRYENVSENQRLDRAFEIRLLLFEVAETMLLYDQPIIPLYFYTSTQLWPPELQNMFINNRDVHPLKVLRWQGGKRPLGDRYEDFPRLSPRIRTEL